MTDTFDAAERRIRQARARQRDTAYQAGFAARGSRQVPAEYALADEDWFRGYDDGNRRAGYYIVEGTDEHRQPAQWTGTAWFVIGDDVPHKSVGEIIAEIETYPELTGDGWC